MKWHSFFFTTQTLYSLDNFHPFLYVLLGPESCSSNPCMWNQLCRSTSTTGYECIDEVVDPCRPPPCHSHAHCVRKGLFTAEYTCLCMYPYTGNGHECSGENIVPNATLQFMRKYISFSVFVCSHIFLTIEGSFIVWNTHDNVFNYISVYIPINWTNNWMCT